MMTISQPLHAPLVKYEANNMHPIHRRLPFVHKLYHVVNSGNHIAWTQDGLSFYIPDINTFDQEVIKKSFNNSCMLSFVRQLLIYGFKRTFDGRRTRYRKPTNYASFTHPNFQRDHPNLLNLVKRQKREKKPNELPLNSHSHITQAPPTLNLHPTSIPNFSLPHHMDRLYSHQTSVYGLPTLDSVQTSPPPFNQSPPFSQYDSPANFTYPTVISGISQSSYFPQSPGLYPQSPILTTHHHHHISQMTIPPPPTPLLNSFPNMHSPPEPSTAHHHNNFYYPPSTVTTTTNESSMAPYYTQSQLLVSPTNYQQQFHYSSN